MPVERIEPLTLRALPATAAPATLRIAVPEFEQISPRSGIGRVFCELRQHWGERVQVVPAAFQRIAIPLLRNFPYAIKLTTPADLVFLPKLTGAQALKQKQDLPSLVIVHDVGIVDQQSNDRQALDPITYHSIRSSFYQLPSASQIIVDSRFTRDRLSLYLPEVRSRVNVIYPGVNTLFLNYAETRNVARKQLEQLIGPSTGGPLLAYVGTELPRKNIGLLLKVFSQIRRRYPGAQLLKVGGAGEARWRRETLRLARQQRLKVGQDLIFVENIDDTVLAALYRAADLFVSTSLYEGFGLPALEALAVGTPVVVSNRGSLPEIVAPVGRSIPAEQEAFVSAIEALLDSAPNESFRTQARQHAARYSWQQCAEQYLARMEQICDRNLH